MKTVVTWMWKGNRDYKPEHVNTLGSMLKRNLSNHRFVCITDSAEGFSSSVEVMAIPKAAQALGNLSTPEESHYPSCYRRLWMFSDEAKILGDRVLMTDLDVVITGNMDHLFDYKAPFVGFRPLPEWGHLKRLGGGFYVIDTGSQTRVYDDFKGQKSIDEARAAGYRGSDQAWISYKLIDTAEILRSEDGVVSVRTLKDLPPGTCIAHFNGTCKPWDDKREWVRKHYR